MAALLGVAVLLSSTVGNWFQSQRNGQTISGYAKTIEGKPLERATQELQAAIDYNKALPEGRTPVNLVTLGSILGPEETEAYHKLLNDGPDGMMGVLTIPSLGLNLPVFHGTDPTVLDLGVGHVEGTSLPVGGSGTHSVLSAHSGVVGKDLFTRLDKVVLGDTFTITVLNQTHTYKVDHIDVVVPTETSELAIEPGKDYATLVTCTPVGINSHRLLVRGVRMPDAQSPNEAQILRSAGGAGFPWWALLALGAVVVIVVATSPLAARPEGAPVPRPRKPPRPRVGTHRRPTRRELREQAARDKA